MAANKSKAARARARAVTRIQQQHPGAMAAVGGPTVVQSHPQTGDNPWREQMVPAYREVQDFEQNHPDIAAEVRSWGDEVIVDIVLGIAEHDDPLSDELMLGGAAMLRRWAIMHKLVWLYDWEIPIAALSDQEIIVAVLSDKLAGNLPTRAS